MAAEKSGPAFALILAAVPLLVLLRVIGFAAPHQDPKTLALIALGAGLVALAPPRRGGLRRLTPGGWLLLALLGWAALGLIWSPNPCRGGVRLSMWIAAALTARAAQLAARRRESWWPALAWALSGTGAVFGIAFWWGYSRSLLGTEYSPWVFFSPLGHVNFTGDFAVPWLALLVAVVLDRRAERALRFVGLLAAVSLLLTVLIGASRAAVAGGLLAAIAGVVAARPGTRWRIALLLGALMAAGALLYAALPMPFRPLSRLVEAEADGFGTMAAPRAEAAGDWLGPRRPMYAAAWRMARAAPVLGHGTGSFVDVYPAFARGDAPGGDPQAGGATFVTNPHDALLAVACELGLLAALAFGVLLLRVLVAAWRGARKASAPERVGLLAALAAMIPGLLFSHTAHNAPSLFLLALCGGLACAAPPPGGAEAPRRLTRSSTIPRVALTLLALVGAAIGPGRHFAARWQLGLAIARGSDPRAEPLFLRARELDPHSFRAGIGVAAWALERGEIDAARAELRRVAAFHPSPRILAWLAQLPPVDGEHERDAAGDGRPD